MLAKLCDQLFLLPSILGAVLETAVIKKKIKIASYGETQTTNTKERAAVEANVTTRLELGIRTVSNDYSRLIAAMNEGNCLLAGSKGGGVTPEELTQFLQLALVSAASLAGRPLKLWTRRAASLHPTGTFHADNDSNCATSRCRHECNEHPGI